MSSTHLSLHYHVVGIGTKNHEPTIQRAWRGDLHAYLVLCNRYGFTIAARSLGEFQGASEAPVFAAILAEGATRKFAQRTAARRVGLKMARRRRCFSVAGRKGHDPSSRLGGGPF